MPLVFTIPKYVTSVTSKERTILCPYLDHFSQLLHTYMFFLCSMFKHGLRDWSVDVCNVYSVYSTHSTIPFFGP